MQASRNIQARAQPDGDGHQVSVADRQSRSLYRFPMSTETCEQAPNGAGSYHDPKQHQMLMERFDDYLRDSRTV